MATAPEFTYEGETFKPGDEVTVCGYAGTWIIKDFCRNPRSTNGEWYASLTNGTRPLFWPAHELTKA